MADQVQIANMALIKLGQGIITSIDEESVRAEAIKAVYDMLRQAELRFRFWRFAIKHASLSAVAATDPDPPNTSLRNNAFNLPSDYLRMAPDDPSSPQTHRDWLLEQNRIYTNDGSPLVIRYSADITNAGLFDALFAQALAMRIAETTCVRITNSDVRQASCKAAYDEAIKLARRVNAIEVGRVQAPEDEWVRVRSQPFIGVDQ